MEAVRASQTPGASISEEDFLRSQYYRLLAGLLAVPPSGERLLLLAGLEGDDSELGQALNGLRDAAVAVTPDAIAEEFQTLFIGLGRGELLPFGSYYLTGFLHEKPLAKLRQDMAKLGMARAEDVKEPEDHVAFLCEMMAGLIEGDFGAPADLTTQRSFFEDHLEVWADRFFEDLEGARSASFYKAVGTLGRRFIGIESKAFQML